MILPHHVPTPQSVARVQVRSVTERIDRFDFVVRTKAGQLISFNPRWEEWRAFEITDCPVTNASMIVTQQLATGHARIETGERRPP